MIAALAHQHAAVRAGAARVLEGMGASAVSLLIGALEHELPAVRGGAAAVLANLGKIARLAARPMVKAALGEADAAALAAQRRALILFGGAGLAALRAELARRGTAPRLRLLTLIKQLRHHAQPLLKPVSYLLRDPSVEVRLAALGTLHAIAGEEARPFLEKASKDRSPRVVEEGRRLLALPPSQPGPPVKGLRKARSPVRGALSEWLEKLASDDPKLRAQACQALGAHKQGLQALQPLMAALADDELFVAEAARDALLALMPTAEPGVQEEIKAAIEVLD